MSFSLLQPLRDIPFAFVDVETTGASADFGHRVIEIGIARVEGGQITAQYQQLVDPQRRISAGVTVLTGISQPMVDGQPTFAAELPKIIDLMRGAIVVGHNVRFDLGFLRKEFRRGGRDIVESIGDVPVMDTVRIARRRFGRGGNGLQALAPRLGVFPTVAHRALADVLTTVGVFEKLLEPVGGWDLPLCDALLAQGGKMGLLPANPRESLLPLELEEALEMRRAVMMEYLDARQARTHRVIEPRHVKRVAGELILVAHCHLRDAQRTFKLDRIVQLTRVDSAAPTCAPVSEPTAGGPVTPSRDVVSSDATMFPRANQFQSAEVQTLIDELLLSGASQTMGEAEGRFLDEHLPQIASLVESLSDEDFREHEAVKLLLSHGSRPWEDSLR